MFFFKNYAENEAGRLVQDLFLFFKKALYDVSSCMHWYLQVASDGSVDIDDDKEQLIVFSVLLGQTYSHQKKAKLPTFFSARV